MTTPEQHEKVYELFVNARMLDAAACAAYLDKACADDPSLREEVEALLSQDSEMTSFLEQPLAPTPLGSAGPDTISSSGKPPAADDGASDAVAGIIIEGYEILRELHRGGQGVVFQAIQKSTKRKVAIKVLREGPFASKPAQKRFEREIELVAQLKHPNIIAIFDSGITADGWQYCTMDYVRGTQLHHYIRENRLTLEETLNVFEQVCDAVQYAHHKGVIHRDLKPSNILVDAEGNTRVLDFGLAKQMIGPIQTVVSMTQEIIGTLPYISPEQAMGNPDHIDTRTDIYALGVILYEILTGHYPYPVAGQMAEVFKHIAETPPAPPSRKWSNSCGITERSSKRLKSGQCPIDSELQTIVLKPLAKERERRYQSAGELARDIQHYLAGEAIEANRDSGLYVLRKTLRRYRVPVIVAATFVFAVTIVGSIAWQQYSQRKDERARTIIAQREAEVSAFLNSLVRETTPSPQQLRILADVCDRLRAGTASRLDQQAFITAFLFVEFRAWEYALLDDPREQPVLGIGISRDWANHTPGLGLMVTPSVLINGAPASVHLTDHLLWIEADREHDVADIGGCDHFGSFRLSGTVSVHIVERLDHASKRRSYRILTQRPLDVPIRPTTATIVDSLPDNYPPRIINKQESERLVNGFEVEAILRGSAHNSIPAEQSEAEAIQRRLLIRMSFPTPRYRLACAFTVSSPAISWRQNLGFVFFAHDDPSWGVITASISDPSDSWGDFAFFSGGHQQRQDRYVVEIGYRLEKMDEVLSDAFAPGKSLTISITPSPDVARRTQASGFRGGYLDLPLDCTVEITLADSDNSSE